MKTKTAIGTVRDVLHGSTVGRNKAGNIVARHGYFYTNGCDAQKYAASVAARCTAAGLNVMIVDQGNHWAPFRGGQSVKAGSHWWVELKVTV